jgi:hypothetical protein
LTLDIASLNESEGMEDYIKNSKRCEYDPAILRSAASLQDDSKHREMLRRLFLGNKQVHLSLPTIPESNDILRG